MENKQEKGRSISFNNEILMQQEAEDELKKEFQASQKKNKEETFNLNLFKSIFKKVTRKAYGNILNENIIARSAMEHKGAQALGIQNQDLSRSDKDKRTVFHRAALEQNIVLLRDLCKKASQLENYTNLYIDKKDKFGNSPLICACILNVDGPEDKRYDCLKVLLETSADANVQNTRTRWTALTWSAYYGDVNSIELLLDNGAHPYYPDHEGYYPIDWAGTQGHADAVKCLLRSLMESFREYEDLTTQNPKILEEKYKNRLRFIKTPLLRSSCLYWAIQFCTKGDAEDIELIRELLTFTNVIPELQLKATKMQNCFHACCDNGNEVGLKLLLESLKDRYKTIYKKYQKNLSVDKNQTPEEIKAARKKFKSEQSKRVFEFLDDELKIKKYTRKFMKYVKKTSDWISEFEKRIFEGARDDFVNIRPFEDQDDFGNTPLHIASLKGRVECVEALLEAGANTYLENKEGWRCHELQQHESIRVLYSDYLKKMSEKNLATVINHSMTPGKKGVVIPIQGDIEKVGVTQFLKKFNFFKKSSKSKVSSESDRKMKAEQLVKKMISYYKEERYIPDVVVVFKVSQSQTTEGESNSALLNSVNFYISIAANFDAYLAPGVEKNLYYLMIKMNDEKLAEECSNLGLKMKLLNSYEYEAFDYKRITDFEPFRSRQRQEITLNVIRKLLDVDQLKEQNVIQKIYLMHTVSGAHRIKEIWLKSKKWYWPEPLTSYREYFSEGKHLNFTAITALRQYFGEKISFYFAWVSFYTVYLLILAVPGVVFFILNQRFQDNLLGLANLMLSIWVGLTALATTLLTERWKRKGAEIATRWGVLGLLTNTSSHKQVRKEFSGDEMISETTGFLTKYNGRSRTVLYFIASFPVLLLLLALVVATFVATYQLQDLLNDKNVLLRYLPGIINGIVITIINYLYGRFARYFVEKENHKYQSNYERSLIFKTFLFKFLNSFLGIFYIAFIQDIVQQNGSSDTMMTLPIPNNQDRPPVVIYQRSTGNDNAYLSNYLSNTLLSLVITRQISSFVASCVLPLLQYKYKEKLYYKTVSERAKDQSAMKRDDNYVLDELEEIDGIEKSKRRVMGLEDPVYRRPVLDCKTGENSKKQWELAQVELNGLKSEQKDLIDYYGDMFMQLGYITMFAAAFPLGPVVALVANILDTRAKIFAFLTALKRPVGDKSAGIGDWMIIWEIMSVLGLYTNAALLWKFNENEPVFGFEGESKIWFFVIVVHIVLATKYIVIGFIKDRPKWVEKEEEKQNFLEEQAIDDLKDRRAEERNALLLIEKSEKETKKAQLEFATSIFNKDRKTPKGLTANSLKKKMQPLLNVQSANLNINPAIKLLFWNTYNQIDRELLVLRMIDIVKNTNEIVIKCDICRKEKAIVECHTCNEKYCKKCFLGIHNKVTLSAHNLFSLTQDKPIAKKENLGDLAGSTKESDTSSDNGRSESTQLWRKFETYGFPTSKYSDYHDTIQKAFTILYKIYVEENKVSEENTLAAEEESALELSKIRLTRTARQMTIKPKQEAPPSSNIGSNQLAINQFLELENYNLEEKMIMNRIAFLNCKKRGAKFQYADFYRHLKMIQENSLESKLFLAFDLMDEDDDGFIVKQDIMKLLEPSFLQNLRFENEIDDLLTPLFKYSAKVDKKIAFKTLLSDQKLKDVMAVFLQANN